MMTTTSVVFTFALFWFAPVQHLHRQLDPRLKHPLSPILLSLVSFVQLWPARVRDLLVERVEGLELELERP